MDSENQDGSVHQMGKVDVAQDHSDHEHGQGCIASADALNGLFQKGGEREVQRHEQQTEKTGQDAGMGDDFSQGGPFVGDAGKDRQSLGPHHDALRNQVDAGEHQTNRSENTFCHRISEEGGV